VPGYLYVQMVCWLAYSRSFLHGVGIIIMADALSSEIGGNTITPCGRVHFANGVSEAIYRAASGGYKVKGNRLVHRSTIVMPDSIRHPGVVPEKAGNQ